MRSIIKISLGIIIGILALSPIVFIGYKIVEQKKTNIEMVNQIRKNMSDIENIINYLNDERKKEN